MIRYDRLRMIGLALAAAVALAPALAHAEDDNAPSKSQKLIQSFTPYERAMYLKQQGKYDEAIQILEPMAAQGHGFEMAQLSLGQCYLAASEKAPQPTSHDELVKGTKWILTASDGGLPAAQVQLIHMLIEGGRFKVEPVPAGMWYIIWKRNPARAQTGVTELDPPLLHQLQATLTPDDWQKAKDQAANWQPR